jgi:hypothetical protein
LAASSKHFEEASGPLPRLSWLPEFRRSCGLGVKPGRVPEGLREGPPHPVGPALSWAEFPKPFAGPRKTSPTTGIEGPEPLDTPLTAAGLRPHPGPRPRFRRRLSVHFGCTLVLTGPKTCPRICSLRLAPGPDVHCVTTQCGIPPAGRDRQLHNLKYSLSLRPIELFRAGPGADLQAFSGSLGRICCCTEGIAPSCRRIATKSLLEALVKLPRVFRLGLVLNGRHSLESLVEGRPLRASRVPLCSFRGHRQASWRLSGGVGGKSRGRSHTE